jgi:hypothetical protein
MEARWGVVALCFAAACNSSSARSAHPHEPSPYGGADMAVAAPPGGTDDGGAPAGPTDVNGDPACGVQNFTLAKGLPPDLLIVLDRSASMDDALNGGATKWQQVTAAINSTVTTLQGQIKWGLEMFPSDDSCGVSPTVNVPVATMNAAAVTGAINGAKPGGSTPTTDAIHLGAKYLAGVSDGNPKFLVLATDGEPNCGSTTSTMPPPPGPCTCPSGTTASGANCCVAGLLCLPCTTLASASGSNDNALAEQAITDAANMGIHTFVVGIAADSSDDAVLTQMAINGKQPQPGTPKYYPVSSQMDLVTAIDNIASQIISCSYMLATPPSKPDQVEIDADGMKVPYDPTHANGWDYGPGNASVQFYGGFCGNLQSGQVKMVQAIYLCGPVS